MLIAKLLKGLGATMQIVGNWASVGTAAVAFFVMMVDLNEIGGLPYFAVGLVFAPITYLVFPLWSWLETGDYALALIAWVCPVVWLVVSYWGGDIEYAGEAREKRIQGATPAGEDREPSLIMIFGLYLLGSWPVVLFVLIASFVFFIVYILPYAEGA